MGYNRARTRCARHQLPRPGPESVLQPPRALSSTHSFFACIIRQ